MHTLISPWPPQRTGIADYSYEIARHSPTPFELVTEAARPTALDDRMRVVSGEDFLRKPGARRLYHFGNNPDHVYMVPMFLRHPGVAVVHDASLHYLAELTDTHIPGFFRHAVSRSSSVDADALRRVWKGGMKRPFDYTEVRCLDWLGAAKSIIVHSHYARRQVSACLPGMPVHVIPHFAYPDMGVTDRSRVAARAALGLAEDAHVVVTLGFVTRNKQYDSVMRAINALPKATRDKTVYIVAGQVRPEEYDIAADIRTAGAGGYTRLMNYVSDAMMQNLLHAADLVVNLRFPTFGESSGSVARALGVGAVLVVPAAGSFGEIPETACFHVRSAEDVTSELTDILTACFEDPELLVAKREGALDYAYFHLSPVQCAARYDEIVYAD